MKFTPEDAELETDYFNSVREYIDYNPTLLIAGANVDEENVPLNLKLSLEKLDKKITKGFKRLEERVETLEKEVQDLKAERDALAVRVANMENASLDTKRVEINVAKRVRDMIQYQFELATHQMEKKLRDELQLKPSEKEPPTVNDLDDDGKLTEHVKRVNNDVGGDETVDVKRETVDVAKDERHEDVKLEYTDVATDESPDAVIASVMRQVAVEHQEEDTVAVEHQEEDTEKMEEEKYKEEEEKEQDKEKTEEEKENTEEDKLGRRPLRQKKRAAAVVSPYTQETKKTAKKMKGADIPMEKKTDIHVEQTSAEQISNVGSHMEVKTIVKIPLPTEPTKVFGSPQRYELIKKWLAKNKKKRGRVAGIRTVVQTIDPISCNSLDLLFNADGWLSSEHVDAHLYILNKQAEMYQHMFTSTSWTCMGSLYNSAVKYAYKMFVADRKMQEEKGKSGAPFSWSNLDMDMCKFVHGMHDNWYSKAWLHCHFVYGIENIANSHWAAYAYSFTEKAVYVYDSMSHKYVDQRQEIFSMHAAIAPSLHNECVNTEEEKINIDIPYQVKLVEDTPQQENGSDCGVYAIKFVQCLAMLANFSDLLPGKFPHFRMKLAADLIRWTRIGDTLRFHEQDVKK